jgi:hypothetical protein
MAASIVAEVEKGKRVSEIADVRDVVRAVMKVSKTNIDDCGHPDALGLVNLDEFIDVDGLLGAAQIECRKAAEEIEKRRWVESERLRESVFSLVNKTFGLPMDADKWNFELTPNDEEIRPGFRSIGLSWRLVFDGPDPVHQQGMSFRVHYTATLCDLGSVSYAFSYATARALTDNTTLLMIANMMSLRKFFEDVVKAMGVPTSVTDMVTEYVVVLDVSGKPIELPRYNKTSLTYGNL